MTHKHPQYMRAAPSAPVPRGGRAMRMAAAVIGGWVLLRLALVTAGTPAPAFLPPPFLPPPSSLDRAASIAMPGAQGAGPAVVPDAGLRMNGASQSLMRLSSMRPSSMRPSSQRPSSLSAAAFGGSLLWGMPDQGFAQPPALLGSASNQGTTVANRWRLIAARQAQLSALAQQDAWLSRLARMQPAAHRANDVSALALLPPASGYSASPGALRSSRLTGYAWLLYRDKSGAETLAPGGELGGSQAGLRLGYRLSQNGSAQAFVRLSRPISRRGGAEAAAGLSLRPRADVPVQLSLERRVALERGGRNAMAAYISGGVGPQPIARNIEAEAYGQAGIVGFNRRDIFADGAARAAFAAPLGSRKRIAAGAAIWASAQPGVSRIDVGPQIQLRSTVAPQVRLSLDWRERVGGTAKPSSGIALTLSAGF